MIISHDVIKNTISKYPNDEQIPLDTDKLLTDIKSLPRKTGIVNTNREGASDIFNDIKSEVSIALVHVVNDLLSKRKKQQPELVKEYHNLQQIDFNDSHS